MEIIPALFIAERSNEDHNNDVDQLMFDAAFSWVLANCEIVKDTEPFDN